MQHYFAALDGKRFLLSDIAQDVPVLTDMHVPTLARLLNVLQLLVLGLFELLQILCLFYSLCIALQPHTTLQSEHRLPQLIVYWLNQWFLNFFEALPKSRQRLYFITLDISQ